MVDVEGTRGGQTFDPMSLWIDWFNSDLVNLSHFSITTSDLDKNVLKSLPIFIYNLKIYLESLNYFIRLFEFEENEFSQVLPV